MHSARRPRGSLEQSVLVVVAEAGCALTPAEVRDRIDSDLAYTTVMTVMARLADKDLLARERSGRGYAYAAISDEAITARQMQKLLDTQSDRAAVLARFVGTLQPGDEAVLAELLANSSGDAEP